MSKQNKTINFLYEASKHLPTNKNYAAIRSHMLLKSNEINYSSSLRMNLVARCNTCGVVFNDLPPTRSIKPVKNLKCYRRLENGARNFTKYQILSYKKFKLLKNRKQILVTQCNCCNKKTENIIKKAGRARKPKIRPKPYNVNSARKLKNKQRRRHREYSGLKKSAVLSAKRSLEVEQRYDRSPERLKIDTNVIDLCTPEPIKIKQEFITPEPKKIKEEFITPEPKKIKEEFITPEPKKIKEEFITPETKKIKKEFSTPETNLTLNSNVLTSNTMNKKSDGAGPSRSQNSDVICLDSPTKPVKKNKNVRDKYTPTFSRSNRHMNRRVIEISDTEERISIVKKRKRKIKRFSNKQYEQIEKTPKIKNNNNIVLVSEYGSADIKKKKLNNLSNFLKNASNNQKSNQNNILQNFLSTFT